MTDPELRVFAEKYLGPVFEGNLSEFHSRALSVRARAFYNHQPVEYARVVRMLMDGVTPLVTARLCNRDVEVVRQMRRLYPEIMAIGRQQIVNNLEEVSLELTHRLLNELHDIPIHQVANTLGTVIEKTLLLTGGATSRTEHINAPKPEELLQMFEALPKAKAQVVSEA